MFGADVAVRKALGFFHLLTGFWLMYLVFAVTLDITLRYTLPT